MANAWKADGLGVYYGRVFLAKFKSNAHFKLSTLRGEAIKMQPCSQSEKEGKPLRSIRP